MEQESAIQLSGAVTQVMPGGRYRVALANGREVVAHVSGEMRKRFIRISVGDRVHLEVSPYDLQLARIIFREG